MVIKDEQSLKTTPAFVANLGCSSYYFEHVVFLFSELFEVKVGLGAAK